MHTVEAVAEGELLSLDAAAEFLFVSKSTMYRLLDQGKLRGMKAGKQWRFRKEDLLAYLQRGPAALALANLPIAVLDTELDFFAGELEKAGTTIEASDDPTLEGEAGKIAQLVRRMVWLLYTRRGSDLHLEPVWEAGEEYLLIRPRVDGALIDLRRMPIALHEPLILEWKRRAGLAIEERSRPQDGSAIFTFRQKRAPLRVSIVPTLYGEKLAIRTIPMNVPTLEMLGLDKTPLNDWIQHFPTGGLILFTGPTGSGKATSAAACLGQLVSSHSLNAFTVMDPVEYLFPRGVTHLKVEQFTCADGMRALMRQDPDVIAVGELNGDPELARLTMNAAETGHLVMTTMHTHDAIKPLYEFLEWNIRRSLLAANIIGIVNQRLLFKLCDACKAPQEPAPEMLVEIRQGAEEGGYQIPEEAVFYTSVGCEQCKGNGFAGRFALHEYFTFNQTLRAAFLRGMAMDEFTKLAREQGQISSFAAGVQKAVEGITSLDEVLRKVSRWRT
ncbi:MAG TPA: ATPase, T2SS/T4P/T4SS family [Armatimonadota bacterium]|jgi:type IV pilus assembly protein PilB